MSYVYIGRHPSFVWGIVFNNIFRDMKTIIAGGRDYWLKPDDYKFLVYLNPKITEVVNGGASGVDECGKFFGREISEIPVTTFKADWIKYSKAAGPIRNENMAKYADRVILFPGGKGTKNMSQMAKKYNLIIIDKR